MQKISKGKAIQKFIQYSFDSNNTIPLNRDDYDLLLESKYIYFIEREFSTTEVQNINFKDYNISNANTILVNFTIHTDYSISIISETMEILSDLCNEDASVVLSTTPIEECDIDYMKLDIFLGFNQKY